MELMEAVCTPLRVLTHLLTRFQAQKMPEMKWALRHTWQSWRERYKKNKDRLDVHIAAIVKAAMSDRTSPLHTNRENSGALQETPEVTPNWAKRKGSEEDDTEDDTSKRHKPDNPFRTFVLTPGPPPSDTTPSESPAFASTAEFVADFRVQTPWNPVEEEIESIAREFRFMQDEVRAYYDRSKDLVATRHRFEMARTYIDALP